MARSWGRLYAGTRNHRKIKALAAQFPTCWTSWYVLIELAIECDDDGWIYLAPGVPFSMKQLAKEIGIKRSNTCERLVNALAMLSLIESNERGIKLISFSERNYESDSSTPRVQKFREKWKSNKKEKRFSNGDVTKGETDQNRTETEHINTINTLVSPDRRNGVDEEFEIWWKAYPNRRKTGKPAAIANYKYLRRSNTFPPLDKLLAVLEAQKKSIDWTKDGGDFIPGPVPYLNQGKYIDESIPDLQAAPPTPKTDCPDCHGRGMVPTEKDGVRGQSICSCRKKKDG